MIDSITRSFCLHHYVQNGLSYSGKETLPKLCINNAKLRSGVLDLEQNKHQLLHIIASVKTPLTSIVVRIVFNILCAAITGTDPKSAKNTIKLSVFFVLFCERKRCAWNVGEIDPGSQFYQYFTSSFCADILLSKIKAKL